MTVVDQALGLVGHWLAWLFSLLAGVFVAIEAAMRRMMNGLHIAAGMQTVILLLVDVVLIVLAVRVLGGVFRILLMAFLVLLLVHIVLAGAR